MCQVIERKGELRVLRTLSGASQNGTRMVQLRGFPALVSLAGGRQESGWFLVVIDPGQKVYWWQFGVTPDPNPWVEAFNRECLVSVGTKQLGVFCSTYGGLNAVIAKKTYTTESGIAKLVESEFAQRVPSLDRGMNYFEKNITLQPVLGRDFFFESGRADAIRQPRLLSVNRVGEDWQIVMAGARQLVMKVILSSDLTVRGSSVVR